MSHIKLILAYKDTFASLKTEINAILNDSERILDGLEYLCFDKNVQHQEDFEEIRRDIKVCCSRMSKIGSKFDDFYCNFSEELLDDLPAQTVRGYVMLFSNLTDEFGDLIKHIRKMEKKWAKAEMKVLTILQSTVQ